MLITRQQLREAILYEIALTGSGYQFVPPENLNLAGDRRNPFESIYSYSFVSTDKEGNADLDYSVAIGLAMNSSQQPYWDIMFSAAPAGVDVVGDGMQLTGKNDIQVYTTVAHIVKHFVENILDKIPDSDVRVFGFSGIKETMHAGGDQRADTYRVTSRRTAIYLKLLQKNITRMIPGSQVLQSYDENVVYFIVP